MKDIKLPKKILKPGRMLWHSYMCDVGGCGHYRVLFPYLLLNGMYYKGFEFMPSVNQQFITDINYYKTKAFVIFQRSAENQHLEFMKALKKALPKLNIIFESDDNMFDIPKWNKAYEYYNGYANNIKEMLKLSTGMTVSTLPLKNEYKKYNKNIIINPNHLPKFLWGDIRQVKPILGKPRILWAGSENHYKVKPNSPDGGDFGKKLLDFIKKTIDKYQWVFVGGMPQELYEVKNKIEWYQWKSMLQYPEFMKSLYINIGIAPLENNTFNNGKSNIKAKEYTSLGIPGVYSNSYPYKDLSLSCETEEYMIDMIELLCNNEDKRNEVFNHDYNYLKNELYWEENNNIIKYLNNILSLINCELP